MTDAQTQTILRVPTPMVVVREPEVAAPDLEGEVAQTTESVQEMYEAGMARLEALHDRWAAAIAEVRDAQASGEPGQAAT